jgi:hypothetical protein
MNDSQTDKPPRATNRQGSAVSPHAGAFVAGHRAAIEWALSVSRDPARRLAIARRIARETSIASNPRHANQTRLN